MMQLCHYCPEWAQWRVMKPHFDDKGKLTNLELISLLCGVHKQEQAELPESKLLRFDFVGAVPLWH